VDERSFIEEGIRDALSFPGVRCQIGKLMQGMEKQCVSYRFLVSSNNSHRLVGAGVVTMMAALWLVGCFVAVSGCNRKQRYSEPDVEVVRRAIGDIAAGRGCLVVGRFFQRGSMSCSEDRYQAITAPTIVVGTNGEMLHSHNLPAGFSEDEYVFWISRDNSRRTRVYEEVSDNTFLVENHMIVQFVSGGGPKRTDRPWTRVRPVGGMRSWMLNLLLVTVWLVGICFALWLMWGFLNGAVRTIWMTVGVLRMKRRSSSDERVDE
jgi:hypothetical protein